MKNKIFLFKTHYFIFIVFILILGILFNSCGIPSPYLSLKNISIQTKDLPYSFTFLCQNTETYFKGYNFYYKVEGEITEHPCTIKYGDPAIISDNNDPLLPINDNTSFFQNSQIIKVYLAPTIAPTSLNVDVITNNPLEVILYDVDGYPFDQLPYTGKKVTFIIRPYGLDLNNNPIPFNDSSSNKIEVTF